MSAVRKVASKSGRFCSEFSIFSESAAPSALEISVKFGTGMITWGMY